MWYLGKVIYNSAHQVTIIFVDQNLKALLFYLRRQGINQYISSTMRINLFTITYEPVYFEVKYSQ